MASAVPGGADGRRRAGCSVRCARRRSTSPARGARTRTRAPRPGSPRALPSGSTRAMSPPSPMTPCRSRSSRRRSRICGCRRTPSISSRWAYHRARTGISKSCPQPVEKPAPMTSRSPRCRTLRRRHGNPVAPVAIPQPLTATAAVRTSPHSPVGRRRASPTPGFARREGPPTRGPRPTPSRASRAAIQLRRTRPASRARSGGRRRKRPTLVEGLRHRSPRRPLAANRCTQA